MQAFGVVSDCLGQVRTAGMGQATGIDMSAALGVMRLRGCESEQVLELVTAAEGAAIEAVNGGDEQ